MGKKNKHEGGERGGEEERNGKRELKGEAVQVVVGDGTFSRCFELPAGNCRCTHASQRSGNTNSNIRKHACLGREAATDSAK